MSPGKATEAIAPRTMNPDAGPRPQLCDLRGASWVPSFSAP
jgi:hypothetical protein